MPKEPAIISDLQAVSDLLNSHEKIKFERAEIKANSTCVDCHHFAEETCGLHNIPCGGNWPPCDMFRPH